MRLLKLASNGMNVIGIGVLIEKLHVDCRQCLTREPRMRLANTMLITFQKLIFKKLSHLN